MSSGLVALAKWQGTIEAAYGTGGTATRIIPMTATPNHTLEVFEGEQDRGTLIAHYTGDTIPTKERAEFTAEAIATFEDVPWFLNAFVAGFGVTGTAHTGASGGYDYTFTPNATADDLKTLALEFGTDTGAYLIPGVVGQKLEINYDRNSPVMLSMGFVGQTLTSHSLTGSLSQRSLEAMETGLTTCYIDPTTNNWGTTNPANVLSAKVTIDNGTEMIYPLGGARYATTYARPRRTLAFEATIQFSTTTEYDAYLAGTNRRVRLKTTGTQIGSTGVYQSMIIDMFFQRWKAAPLGRTGAIFTVAVAGSTAYDATLGADFKITVVNTVATLP